MHCSGTVLTTPLHRADLVLHHNLSHKLLNLHVNHLKAPRNKVMVHHSNKAKALLHNKVSLHLPNIRNIRPSILRHQLDGAVLVRLALAAFLLCLTAHPLDGILGQEACPKDLSLHMAIPQDLQASFHHPLKTRTKVQSQAQSGPAETSRLHRQPQPQVTSQPNQRT